MSPVSDPLITETFPERRRSGIPESSVGRERRQFVDRRDRLSPEARELAEAVDHYKLLHHRRFITFEELLQVVQSLGYRKESHAEAHSIDQV